MAVKIVGVHEYTEKPSLEIRQMHSHQDYEIFYLISGDVDFCVEGSTYRLKSGDLILMRKGEVHIPHMQSQIPYCRMHVNFELGDLLDVLGGAELLSFFNDRPLGKFNHYPATHFPNNLWREYLNKICLAKDDAARLCYLLPLLSDLAENFDRAKEVGSKQNDVAAAMISYINANLLEDLSLEGLADRFYLSKTHLNRVFRNATGTTVWRYINLKRLFLAKERLSSGAHPTHIFSECGFRDYTTFFRAYKKQFGVSPTYFLFEKRK